MSSSDAIQTPRDPAQSLADPNTPAQSFSSPPPAYTATSAQASSSSVARYNSPEDIRGGVISEKQLYRDQETGNGQQQQPVHTIEEGNSKALGPVDDEGLPELVVASSNAPDRSIVPANSAPLSPAMPSTPAPAPGAEEDHFVTPLHLLGDQPDWVDCPFCRRRVETRVQKDPSRKTHYAATGLFLTTIAGAVAPYKMKYKCHVTHYCTNCDKRVAHQHHGKEMQALGTPEHLREVSKYSPSLAPDSPAPDSVSLGSSMR